MKLSQILSRDQNNFDLVRLLAALAVIVGHAYALAPASNLQDPIRRLIHFDYSGSLAVDIFFFLSGVLVCNSLLRSHDVLKFAVARVLRIMPGLIACVFLCTFVIGPVFTTMNLKGYFGSAQILEYFYSNIRLAPVWPLPGVFEHHANTGVNGSLWTLPAEALMYVCVFILGFCGILFSRKSTLFFILAVPAVYIIVRDRVKIHDVDPEIVPALLLFLLGGLAALFADRLSVSWRWLLVMIAALVLSYGNVWFRPLFYVVLMYATLWFASNPFIRRLKLPGDYSYGIYIYGFVVQQCVVEMFPARGPYFNMALSIPVSVVLGLLSWQLIEKRALQMVPMVSDALRRAFSARPQGLLPLLRSPIIAACLVMLLLPLAGIWAGNLRPVLDESFKVTSWGPSSTHAGIGFNVQPDGVSALWIHTNRALSPDAHVLFGGETLSEMAVHDDLITAAVPAPLYSKAGVINIQVEETRDGHLILSQPVQFIVQ